MKLGLALAHLALDEIDDLLRLRHRILLGCATDNSGAAVKKDHAGGNPFALRIRDDLALARLVDVGYDRKGGAQVNPDGFTRLRGSLDCAVGTVEMQGG